MKLVKMDTSPLIWQLVFSLSFCLVLQISAEDKYNEEVAVFGCFKTFSSERDKTFGFENTNMRCQQECRELGFSLAATHSCSACGCASKFPVNATVGDLQCKFSCGSYCVPQPDKSLQASCGTKTRFVLSGVGQVDPVKEILRQVAQGWRRSPWYRNTVLTAAIKYKVTPPIGPTVTLKNSHHKLCLTSRTSAEGCTGSTGQQWFLRRAEGHKDFFNIVSKDTGKCLTEEGWDLVHAWWECSDTYRQRWQFHQSINWYIQDTNNVNCVYLREDNGYKVGSFTCGHYDQLWKLPLVNANDLNWLENPTISIAMTRYDGTLEKCSILADDISDRLDSYTCKKATKEKVTLLATEIEIVEATPLKASLPEVLGEMICDNSYGSFPILCSRNLQVSYEISSGFQTTTAVSSSVSKSQSLSVSVRVGIPIFNTRTTTSLEKMTRHSKAFASTETIEEKTSITQSYSTSVIVLPGKVAKLSLVREKQDVTFAWKATLQSLGQFELTFPNWYEHADALSRLMRRDYVTSFGVYTYPDVDRIRSIVSDAKSWHVQRLDSPDI